MSTQVIEGIAVSQFATIRASDLIRACKVLARAVPRRSPHAARLYCRITTQDGSVQIETNNTDLYCRADLLADCQPGLSLAIPFSDLQSAARSAGKHEDVEIIIRNNFPALQYGGVVQDVHCIDPAEFHPAPATTCAQICRVASGALAELLPELVEYTDQYSVRYAMTGVDFRLGVEQVILAATDTKRLRHASIRAQCTTIDSIRSNNWPILPVVACQAIAEACKQSRGDTRIEFSTAQRPVKVMVGDYTIVSKSIEGLFPAYNLILDQYNNRTDWSVSFSPQAMLRAIKSIVTSDKKDTTVILTIGQSGMRIDRVTESSKGHAEVHCQTGECSPEDVSIKLDYEFLIDFLEYRDKKETVFMRYVDSDNPVILSGTESTGQSIIMPME